VLTVDNTGLLFVAGRIRLLISIASFLLCEPCLKETSAVFAGTGNRGNSDDYT
jgi:hypothetical protein